MECAVKLTMLDTSKKLVCTWKLLAKTALGATHEVSAAV